MDYSTTRSLASKIETALYSWKAKGEMKCLACGDLREMMPFRIELRPSEDELTVELIGEKVMRDGWIEIYTEPSEDAPVKGVICRDCAERRKVVEPKPEPTATRDVETIAAPVSTTPTEIPPVPDSIKAEIPF